MLLTEDYTRQLTAFTSHWTLMGRQVILYLSRSHRVPLLLGGEHKRAWAKKQLCTAAAVVAFCLVKDFSK